jgi:hypothetical protein
MLVEIQMYDSPKMIAVSIAKLITIIWNVINEFGN